MSGHSLQTFQSTHSMKECDWNYQYEWTFIANISIHALYERVRLNSSNLAIIAILFQSTHSMKECDRYLVIQLVLFVISIHALYERVRRAQLRQFQPLTEFQSTHSMKECDSSSVAMRSMYWISIHALYERVRLQKDGTFVFISHQTLDFLSLFIYKIEMLNKND